MVSFIRLGFCTDLIFILQKQLHILGKNKTFINNWSNFFHPTSNIVTIIIDQIIITSVLICNRLKTWQDVELYFLFKTDMFKIDELGVEICFLQHSSKPFNIRNVQAIRLVSKMYQHMHSYLFSFGIIIIIIIENFFHAVKFIGQ